MTVAADWVRIRPYRASDEGFVLYSWIYGFATSEHGKRWGAQAGKLRIAGADDHLWTNHRPIVLRLLREAETLVACDKSDDDAIVGWACVDGSDVVHYATVRHAVGKDLAPEVARTLLGDRMERPCLITHEQTGLRTCGVRVPVLWKLDTYWLAAKWAKEAA